MRAPNNCPADVEPRGCHYDEGAICLPWNASVWDLAPAQLHAFLHARRRFAKFNHEAEKILWAHCNDDNRFDPTLVRRRRWRDMFNRAALNSFLSAEEKAWCAAVLVAHQHWITRRLERRRATRRPRRPSATTVAESWSAKRRVVARDQGRCRYCGREVSHGFHLEHVIPQAYGGLTTFENLVVACPSCNHHKGGRTPAEAGMVLLPAPPAMEPALV